MAQIVWTAEARRWLQEIYDDIAEDNPEAAYRTVSAIHERAKILVTLTRRLATATGTRPTSAFSSTVTTASLRQMVGRGASGEEVHAAALANGMVDLKRYAAILLVEGLTTVEEVTSVVSIEG